MGVYIVGEIGINHNGDINLAKRLVDAAVDAGCDAVKLQKRDIESVYSKELLGSPRESPWGATQRHQKEGLEFGFDEYTELNQYCNAKHIDWFASAWDVKSLAFLRQFNCPKNKIASAMIVDQIFLTEVASEVKHTFISTGMSTMDDITAAVKIFRKAECPFELMHCVSTYPMRDEDANLNCIPMLRDRFGVNVGYSGHEVGLAVSYAATALNITSLERHITLDRAMYGSDQAASVEPRGLKQLVGAVRKIEKAMGNGKKEILNTEIPIAEKLRAHIKWEANR